MAATVTSIESARRLREYESYITRWGLNGGRTLPLSPPCGCPSFSITVPQLRGGAWSSLVKCPHCAATFMTRRTPNAVKCGEVLP